MPVFDVDIIRWEDGSSRFKIYKKMAYTDKYIVSKLAEPSRSPPETRHGMHIVKALSTEDLDTWVEVENF